MGYLITYDNDTGQIEEYGNRPDERDDLGQKIGQAALLHNTDEYRDLAVMAKARARKTKGDVK